MYDRLFAVPFPGARLPWGQRADAAEAAAPAPAGFIAGEEGDEREIGEVAERNYLDDLNAGSKRVIRAFVEPALAAAAAEERFQFERQGYFVADLRDHSAGHPVFNRTVTLKDSWTGTAAGS